MKRGKIVLILITTIVLNSMHSLIAKADTKNLNGKANVGIAIDSEFEDDNLSKNKLSRETVFELENRSKAEIVNLNKELSHSGLNGKTFSGEKYLVIPSASAPYDSGKLTDGYLTDGLNAVNMIRYIAGFPADIELKEEYNIYTQHASVLLSAIGTLNHHPSKPADMDDEFYDLAYIGTSKGNLAMGYGTIAKSIMGYMEDSDDINIDRVGHRRWILNPTAKYTGLGQTGYFYSYYAFDRSREETIDYDYIAWPAVENHPNEYFETFHAWSVTLNNYKYKRPDISTIKVTLKRVSDNKTWVFNKNTSDGYFNVDTGGYGVANAIIFRPDDLGDELVDGDKFSVKIEGIKYSDGTETEINYITEFFDIYRDKDLNSDGKVDIEDIAICSVSYNKGMGSNGYNDKADFNRDEFIDLFDIVELGKNIE